MSEREYIYCGKRKDYTVIASFHWFEANQGVCSAAAELLHKKDE